MPADPIQALEMRVLTEVINDRDKPLMPLTTVLMGQVSPNTLTTETIQLDRLTGSFEMAPFIEKNGESVALSRKNYGSETIETPMIGLKMPLTASELLMQRRAGQPVFVTGGRDVAGEAATAQITEDMEHMETAIMWREELMISELLTGQIAYTNEKTGASFKITTSKPAANTYTVSVLWDQESARMANDIKEAKRIIQIDNRGPVPTDALCGKNAADAITLRMERGWDTAMKTDSGVMFGEGSLREDWQENGLLFLGRFGGVNFWEVSADYVDDQGNSGSLIRDDYVEYFSVNRTAVADRSMNYGMIPDMEAIQNGLHITRRLADSYYEKDPSAYIGRLRSRPLPWWKQPGWYVSQKVI
jgi:hypothetical protein